MNRKHKLVVIDQADFIGGAELFTLDLLKNIDHKKFEIHLITSGNKKYISMIDQNNVNIRKHSLPRLKPISFRNLIALCRTVKHLKRSIKEINPDIIFSNTVRSHICSSLALRKSKYKLIWYLHDYTFPLKILKILIAIPEKVIANSQAVMKYAKSGVKKKYNSKFCHIPNGIDVDEDNHSSSNIRSELKLNQNNKLIGIVGRIDRWKGQDCFIKAAAKIASTDSSVRFLIIGDSSSHDEDTIKFKKELRTLSDDLNLSKKLYFLGYRENVLDIISQLDILIHTSREKEPLGRVILEGMACRTPVIASNIGGPTEIITHGFDGYLIDPNDQSHIASQAMKLLNNKVLSQKIISNASSTIRKEFHIKKVIRRIEKHLLI